MRIRTLALVSAAALLATSASALAGPAEGPEELGLQAGAGVVDADDLVPSIRDRVRDQDRCRDDGQLDRDRIGVPAGDQVRDRDHDRIGDRAGDRERDRSRVDDADRLQERDRAHDQVSMQDRDRDRDPGAAGTDRLQERDRDGAPSTSGEPLRDRERQQSRERDGSCVGCEQVQAPTEERTRTQEQTRTQAQTRTQEQIHPQEQPDEPAGTPPHARAGTPQHGDAGSSS